MKFQFYILIILILTSCSSNRKSKLTIAAAANIQFAIKDIIQAFEKEHQIKTDLVIGSSGKLTAQIEQGAPYSVFLSADKKYPNALFKSKKAIQKPTIYAKGKLAVWTVKELKINDLNDILDSGFKKIAIANPKTAPYGNEAKNALIHYGIWEKIESKLVFGENIAQTNQYIFSGSCDAGITAMSTKFAKTVNHQGSWVELNAESYSPIEQGVVITTFGNENHSKETKLFYDFLFSPTAKSIFADYGYHVEF